MKLISIQEDGDDILSKCLNEIYDKIGKHIDTKKVFKKILMQIDIFIKHQNVEGKFVKNLTGSIFEFRIIIPGSNYLIRIIFHREADEIVLLTGNIIKPVNYDDKYNSQKTDSDYVRQIHNAQNIINDYNSTQQFIYVTLDLPI